MFTISFQLAGSILLVWTFLTISPSEIIASAGTTLGVGGDRIPANKVKEIKAKLFEKYLSVMGISFIAIGYLIQMLQADAFINKWVIRVNPVNSYLDLPGIVASLINTLLLIVFALLFTWIIRGVIFKRERNKTDQTPASDELRY